MIQGTPKKAKAKGSGVLIAMKAGVTVAAGKSKTVSIPLTRPGRKLFKGRKRLKKLPVTVFVNGTAGETVAKMTLKRVGKVR